MNILLAVVLLTVVYMVHYEYPIYLDKPAVIGGVRTDSPAAQAGLQAGDRIVTDRRHRKSDLGAGATQGLAEPESAA